MISFLERGLSSTELVIRFTLTERSTYKTKERHLCVLLLIPNHKQIQLNYTAAKTLLAIWVRHEISNANRPRFEGSEWRKQWTTPSTPYPELKLTYISETLRLPVATIR